MAVTLNANVFIGTMANLIAYSRVLDTYKVGGALTKLTDKFRGNDISFGDSIIINSATLPTVSDLDTSSSTLLTRVLPGVSQQVISVSAFKYIQLSINEYLMAGAFINESAMATLVAYLISTMQTAKTLHMYGVVERLINLRLTAEITADNHVVTVEGVATDPDNDDAQTMLANATHNSVKFFKWLRNEIRQYELGKKKSFKGASDTTGRKCVETGDNLVVLIHPKLNASLDADALAVLLKSDKLTSGYNVEFIEVDLATISGTPEVITEVPQYAILCSDDAFTYGYFYQVATSFFDPATLNRQNWLHFSYYADGVEYAPLEVIELENFYF